MIIFRFDILSALKEAGFNTNRIRKEKLINETSLQKIRHGQTDLTISTVNSLCRLLSCQPGDILQYIPDSDTEETQAEG